MHRRRSGTLGPFAFELPEQADYSRHQAALYISPRDLERYLCQVRFLTDGLVEMSYNNGLEYTIVWLSFPGNKSTGDMAAAQKEAARFNYFVSDHVSDDRGKAHAFAALNARPRQAGERLRRAMMKLRSLRRCVECGR